MKKTNSIKKREGLKTRALRIETLESRNLLAGESVLAGGLLTAADDGVVQSGESTDNVSWYDLSSSQMNPSDLEQELLEQINRLRSDPQGELDRIFSVATEDSLVARNSFVNSAISLTLYPSNSKDVFLDEMRSISASAPLAFNAALESAATSHSSYMKSRNDISHQCSGESSLKTRVEKAGFEFGSNDNGFVSVSENIGGSFIERNGWSVASYIEAAFVVDWGVSSHSHRDAMTNASYTEIGISIQQTTKSVGPFVVTCDFGSSVDGTREDGAYLLGVLYDDVDKDNFYDVEEGLGGVSITIERLNGEDACGATTISSWNSGGYQLFLLNGSYRVTVFGEGFATPVTKNVSISGGVNSKLDFLSSDAGTVAPSVDLNFDEDGVVYMEGSEDALAVFADSNLSIKDADSSFLYGAKVVLKDRPNEDHESLDVSLGGTKLSASYDEQGSSVFIEGVGSLKEYEDVISSLTYFNDADLCDVSTRSVSITVYDGYNWSDEVFVSIEIQPTKLPQMTVQEMKTYEGDDGVKLASFVVELDSPARFDVSFNFNVAPGGLALEGDNFVVSKGDPIVIAQGETSASIDCYIVGNYDALKPDGLQLINGEYENPFVDFYLEIVDLQYAYLTNDTNLVKGTIFDDDSPVVLGTTDKYVFMDGGLSTDSGLRRYVFTLTPETSGVFSWNANASQLPEHTLVSVREGGLENDPIVVSETTKNGCNVQWFADPNLQYWITVESETDLTSIVAKLLSISDEKTVLVDPLFDDADEKLASLMWNDDGAQLNVGDLAWNFEDDFWNGMAFKTERDDLEFAFGVAPFSQSSTSVADDGSASIVLDGQRGITTTGFSIFSFSGADENETLSLVGTSGHDYLYYSNGIGNFVRSDGVMYSFSGVNNVIVDGNGGDDAAYWEDSYSNDRLESCNDSLVMSGDGYLISAKNFSDMKVFFNKGGEDVYYATDYGDDVTALVSKNAAIFSGAFERIESESQVEASSSLLETADENAVESLKSSYTRTVSGVEHLILEPKESIGAVVLYGDNSSDSYFSVEVGKLVSYNDKTETTTSFSRVKSLVVSGLNKTIDERFTVDLPSSCETYTEGNFLVVIDTETNWTLSIPSWKEVDTVDVSGAIAGLDDYFGLFSESEFLERELDLDFWSEVITLPSDFVKDVRIKGVEASIASELVCDQDGDADEMSNIEVMNLVSPGQTLDVFQIIHGLSAQKRKR